MQFPCSPLTHSVHPLRYHIQCPLKLYTKILLPRDIRFIAHNNVAGRAGSDGSMSASGSAGPGFYPRRGSKFSFENFQPRG